MPATWIGATDSPSNVAAQSTPSAGWTNCRVETSPIGTRPWLHAIAPWDATPAVTPSTTATSQPDACIPTIAPGPSVASEHTSAVAVATAVIAAMKSMVPWRARAALAPTR
jgi:hypothetical protein